MIALNDPIVLTVAGILFCVSGVLFFRRNVFEEDRSLKGPVILLLMGIVLIVAGTAKILFV